MLVTAAELAALLVTGALRNAVFCDVEERSAWIVPMGLIEMSQAVEVVEWWRWGSAAGRWKLPPELGRLPVKSGP